MKTKIINKLRTITLAQLELTPEITVELGFKPVPDYPSSCHEACRFVVGGIAVDMRRFRRDCASPHPSLFELMLYIHQQGFMAGARQKQMEIAKALGVAIQQPPS